MFNIAAKKSYKPNKRRKGRMINNKEKDGKREYFDCHCRTITLHINKEAFPEGLYHGQEMHDEYKNKLIIMGVEDDGTIWFVPFDEDGLHFTRFKGDNNRRYRCKSKKDFTTAGYTFPD